MNFSDLAAPFPKSEVHWRAQKLTNKGDKALALAYLDARDVMRRLDEVCGPENWQDSYVETPSGRIICTLAIYNVDGGWVSKSDGAGDTDFEGAKGAMSDAFKRAAVKWGIGRYLYDLGATYVPCETWQGTDGKPRWSKWTVDPWTCVRNSPAPDPKPQADTDALKEAAEKAMEIRSQEELETSYKALKAARPDVAGHEVVISAYKSQKQQIQENEEAF